FLHSGPFVIERDRKHGIGVKAPFLSLRHLRAHEGRRLEAMLLEPERCPERFAEDERLRGIAPFQPEEKRLLKPLPEKPLTVAPKHFSAPPSHRGVNSLQVAYLAAVGGACPAIDHAAAGIRLSRQKWFPLIPPLTQNGNVLIVPS